MAKRGKREFATLHDVARLAATSIATVSATVNGTAYVSPALRARVLAAIEQVGYAPDGVARSLARSAPHGEGIQVFGPASAPLAILRGRHRRRFLLKCRRDIAPQPLLRGWLAPLKLPGSIRLQIDIDPYSFL